MKNRNSTGHNRPRPYSCFLHLLAPWQNALGGFLTGGDCFCLKDSKKRTFSGPSSAEHEVRLLCGKTTSLQTKVKTQKMRTGRAATRTQRSDAPSSSARHHRTPEDPAAGGRRSGKGPRKEDLRATLRSGGNCRGGTWSAPNQGER